MRYRTSLNELNGLIAYINELTNSPSTPYSQIDGKSVANIGNFNLYQAYGQCGLHRISNLGGGVTTPIDGLYSKTELARLLRAFIRGMEQSK